MYWMADVIAIIVEGVKPQCSMLQQLADVIANWQIELPPQGVFVNTGRCYLPGDRWIITTIGRCYCQVADGIATGLDYFNFSSGVLSRTSSHMCGRWCLPIFLLRDGLLTLMNNASFIHLLRFWSFLPTMLKFSMVTWWPLVLKWSYIGEGALRCSLNLSPNVLEDSPVYSSLHSTLSHLYL